MIDQASEVERDYQYIKTYRCKSKLKSEHVNEECLDFLELITDTMRFGTST